MEGPAHEEVGVGKLGKEAHLEEERSFSDKLRFVNHSTTPCQKNSREDEIGMLKIQEENSDEYRDKRMFKEVQASRQGDAYAKWDPFGENQRASGELFHTRSCQR